MTSKSCWSCRRSYSIIELRPDRLAISHNIVADGIVADVDPEQLSGAIMALLDGSLPAPSGTVEMAAVAAAPLRHLQHVRAKANLASSYAQAGRTNDSIRLMSEVLEKAEDVSESSGHHQTP